MRNFIFSNVEQINMDEIKIKVEEIRIAFDTYLNSYPAKTARTKHSIMGPIGKILQHAKSGKWDVKSLSGYALNIHMMNTQVKGITDESRGALEKGIEKLISLIKEVPVNIQDKVIDLIDYGLYYQRRKKEMESREKTRLEFINFLKEKYKTEDALQKAWEENNAKFEDVYLFGPKSPTFKRASQAKKNDIKAFWEYLKAKGKEEIIETISEEE
ncbi:MAG: hypothetical protein A2Y62_11475 [Candidatus Fischerbacteria bacterium RBG_13_37_8]|uniref:Uncharacterized protein n=1 Tax=Candidatus Fischerbacteria bacterium RBG_13_37_8 TaxID=1817863 RepID=A0A1F5VZ30_9BACT|nr:MAG: hypothetical protein A2Y62_11475 [Candidatus Fischerbacteria bacterium RBG_13_37_8]